MKSRLLFAGVVGLAFIGSNAAPAPKFNAVDVDTKVEIGYGLALADVNGDKKTDILLADKNLIVWYENPSWKKHVIAEKLTTLDHVCIAAHDINGDGKAEVAVGAGWNPGDTENSGAVFFMQPGSDVTQKWTPKSLHHEPTTHRMRWIKSGANEFELLVAPLHGRGNRAGNGQPVKQIAYRKPAQADQPWKLETIDESMHMTHNFDPVQWDDDAAEEVLLGGREAIVLLDRQSGGGWKKQTIAKNGEQNFVGAGEVRAGRLASGRFVASVEAMHGANLCAYTGSGEAWTRQVVASDLAEGHALAVGDLLGSGSDQIVVGWRNKNPEGKVGIRLYSAGDAGGKSWTKHVVDDDKMACEDLQLADLNGDGRLDIIAAGRATKNLKVYFNESPR